MGVAFEEVTITCHVAIVFGKSTAEKMSAFAVGDKIEVVGALG